MKCDWIFLILFSGGSVVVTFRIIPQTGIVTCMRCMTAAEWQRSHMNDFVNVYR